MFGWKFTYAKPSFESRLPMSKKAETLLWSKRKSMGLLSRPNRQTKSLVGCIFSCYHPVCVVVFFSQLELHLKWWFTSFFYMPHNCITFSNSLIAFGSAVFKEKPSKVRGHPFLGFSINGLSGWFQTI